MRACRDRFAAMLQARAPEEDTLADRSRDNLLIRSAHLERNFDFEPVTRDDRSRKNLARLMLDLARIAGVAGGDVREHELLHAGLGGHLCWLSRSRMSRLELARGGGGGRQG